MYSTSPPHRESRRPLAALLFALALVITLVAPGPRAEAVHVGDVVVINDITYYVPDTPTVNGNRLDLYLPQVPGEQTLPLLIWTSGSAWLSDNGRSGAAPIAEIFNEQGYAVAGVSVRSSAQTPFPGQLHDARAAIRWLREHAAEHSLDPSRFAIMGNSSGGWVSAIAGTTSDIVQLPGEPDVNGISSAVQVAAPFFPPTDFLQMDAWYVDHPEVTSFITHDAPLTPVPAPGNFFNSSPESLLVGCIEDGVLFGIQADVTNAEGTPSVGHTIDDSVPESRSSTTTSVTRDRPRSTAAA